MSDDFPHEVWAYFRTTGSGESVRHELVTYTNAEIARKDLEHLLENKMVRPQSLMRLRTRQPIRVVYDDGRPDAVIE